MRKNGLPISLQPSLAGHSDHIEMTAQQFDRGLNAYFARNRHRYPELTARDQIRADFAEGKAARRRRGRPRKSTTPPTSA